MKKLIAYLTTILTLCSLSAAFAFAEPSASDDDPGALFLPSSYEQYLELNEPSDFAISDRYVAIADSTDTKSSVLYLYDKQISSYRRLDFQSGKISAVCFYNDAVLFFKTGLELKYIDCDAENASAVPIGITCNSFLVNKNYIYYSEADTANNTVIKRIGLDEDLNVVGEAEQLKSDDSRNQIPAFSQKGDTVFYTMGSRIYSADSSGSYYYEAGELINSFYVSDYSNKIVYYVSSGNNFYRNETKLFEKNYSNVKEYGGDLYVIHKSNKSIRRFKINENTFDEYEIGKFSDNTARLNLATDISTYDVTTVVADAGNSRISILQGDQITPISLSYQPKTVCAGEESFATMNGTKFYVYDYKGEQIAAFTGEEITGNILGCAYSYGNYYLITDYQNNAYCYDGLSKQLKKGTLNNVTNPQSLASDIYGNLFVYAEGKVFRFGTDEFLNQQGGEIVTEFSSDIRKLLVDYEGNIYGLREGSVQKYDIRSKETTAIPLNLENYVYSQHTLSALSFAFGLSDGSAYILSDGFIVRTDLGISTLNNISADGLYNSLYGTQPSKDDLIVEVKAGSVAVSLDIKSLESDSAYLPYRSYRRLEEDRKGVVLGETDAGYVVLFYEYIPVGEGITSPIHTYDVCLIAKGSAETPAVVADYFSEIKKTGYLSSDVNLYSRPAMQEFTIKDRLKRSSAVAVLGKVSLADGSLDNEYYFVQVADAYGFVPATFVTDANIAALDNENFHYQQLKKGKSVTLESEQGARITLENKERLKVYDGATDKEGYCLVSYEKNGVVYFGEIEASSLSEASPLVIVTLVIVMVVTAAVLLSVCYLLLRRKPTLE